MPGSTIRDFTQPDLFGEAFRTRGVTIAFERAAGFRGSVMRTEFKTVWLQRGFANVARSSRAILTDRVHFAFVAAAGATQIWNGRVLTEQEFFCQVGSDDLFLRNQGVGTWGSVSVLPDDLTRIAVAVAGFDLPRLRDTSRIGSLDPVALARLRHHHAAIARTTRQTPHVFTRQAALRQFDDGMIRSFLACFPDHPPDADRAAARRHHLIMRRFGAWLAERPRDPVTLTEVCEGLGTNARTLHLCCQEFLGMSPIRYLRLRRMHMAHQALRGAIPGIDRVTDIALQHGFSELGRFAQAYRRMFGESPSATLARCD